MFKRLYFIVSIEEKIIDDLSFFRQAYLKGCPSEPAKEFIECVNKAKKLVMLNGVGVAPKDLHRVHRDDSVFEAARLLLGNLLPPEAAEEWKTHCKNGRASNKNVN